MQRNGTPRLRSNKDQELRTRSLEAPLYHDDDEHRIIYITGGTNDPPPLPFMDDDDEDRITYITEGASRPGSRLTSKSSRICTHGVPECRIEPYY